MEFNIDVKKFILLNSCRRKILHTINSQHYKFTTNKFTIQLQYKRLLDICCRSEGVRFGCQFQHFIFIVVKENVLHFIRMVFSRDSRIKFKHAGREYEARYIGTDTNENGVIVLVLSDGM